jgi:hypothetical protein
MNVLPNRVAERIDLAPNPAMRLRVRQFLAVVDVDIAVPDVFVVGIYQNGPPNIDAIIPVTSRPSGRRLQGQFVGQRRRRKIAPMRYRLVGAVGPLLGSLQPSILTKANAAFRRSSLSLSWAAFRNAGMAALAAGPMAPRA